MTDIALVTGGAGFVGKHLVRKLRERGERVRSFDLTACSHDDDIQGSILDPEALNQAMVGVNSVFHLAGNAQLWSPNETVFGEINADGTKLVARSAIATGVRRFVHCSSLTTLVGKKTPIGSSSADETMRLGLDEMLGAYPRSKLQAEHIIENAIEDGLDGVIAMPTEPLGPGDDALTPPTQMILDFVNGATPAFIDCILNFVPVESLADGLIAARDHGRKGERYLLGGENLEMSTLLSKLENKTGQKMPKVKMPYFVALAAGVVDTKLVAALTNNPPKAPLTGVRLAGRQVSFSSQKAAAELSWRSSAVDPALDETLAWFEQAGLLKSV